MPRRPVRDRTALNADERLLVDDYAALLECALARRKQLLFEEIRVPVFLPNGRTRHCTMYRAQSGGDLLTPQQYEQGHEQRATDLRELERALVPLARDARRRGGKLFSLFRRDVYPNAALLAPGAFAAKSKKSWVESADDCWERAVTWCTRLRDFSHDRATALEEIRNALHELRDTYNVFTQPNPDLETIEGAVKPNTQRKRSRRTTSILHALSRITRVSPDTIRRAVKRSDERANHVPVADDKGQLQMVMLPRDRWIGRTVQQEELSQQFNARRAQTTTRRRTPPAAG